MNICIIGAGLSGLSAALELEALGHRVEILEAQERIGGRVQSEVLEGFTLDRGFQVLLTAYPEAQRVFDYEALQLRHFLPGSLLMHQRRLYTLGDPSRHLPFALGSLFAPVGTWAEKWAALRLRRRLSGQSIAEIFAQEEMPTGQAFEQQGFRRFAQHFLQPFFRGIFLEKQLDSSSRKFDFVFKMFAEGHAAVPAKGMQALPEQMAARLRGTIRTGCRVSAIEGRHVRCADGYHSMADAVLLATEASGLVQQYRPQTPQARRSVQTLYFAAPKPILPKAIIALSTAHDALVNNVCDMSALSPHYAPKGQGLVSVSIIGQPQGSAEDMARRAQAELRPYFPSAPQWRLLRHYDIAYALPEDRHVRYDAPDADFKIGEGLYVCGDHLLHGSIEAALRSGRRAAEVIHQAGA